MSISKFDPSITIDYLTNTKENLYFDRKGAKISNQELANEIASFANANGGVIAIGIKDDGTIEGFNIYGINKLNECQKVVTNYLKPTPNYNIELIDVLNNKNEKDTIILFHINPVMNFIVRNNKDEVYLRQGDSSIKLNSIQVRSLEYEKGERNFEAEVAEIINRKKTSAINLLNKLIVEDLIVWTGTSKNDKYGKYIIKY